MMSANVAEKEAWELTACTSVTAKSQDLSNFLLIHNATYMHMLFKDVVKAGYIYACINYFSVTKVIFSNQRHL